MNTIMEHTELCVNTFTEIVEKIASATVNFVLDNFGVSSEVVSTYIKPNDGVLSNLFDVYKQLINFLCFDHFQLQLLKIFILILFTILIMIYGVWHIYGSRISDRFMYPAMTVDVKRTTFTCDS